MLISKMYSNPNSFTVSVLCCVLVFVFTSSCNGQAVDRDKITKMLEASFDCHPNPALAVALVRDGQIIYSKGFGVTDLDSKRPVTEDTLFQIASITKSFAAALFVKLLDEKTNLTLNSKVKEYLKDEFVMPDRQRTEETTFVDMLAHKTGLMGNNRIRFDNDMNRRTVLSRFRDQPSIGQFRVDYIYNNLVYGLIGRMSEMLAGDKSHWEDLIEEHLFKPLGMTRSTFATRLDYSRTDYARGYSELDAPDTHTPTSPVVSKRWAEMCGSGGIISSVKEMANWVNFHVNEGKNMQNHQVLKKKLVDELHQGRYYIKSLSYLGIEKPDFPITVEEGGYALGLRVGYYRGYKLAAHTGGTYGYNTYMVTLPTQKIGAVVLMTGTDLSFRHRAAVAHYLLDTALGIEPYLNASTICSYPNPWANKPIVGKYRPKVTNASLDFPFNEYTGSYTFKPFGVISIEHNSTLDSLIMEYGWGRWQMILWPDSNAKNGQEQRFFGKGIEPNYAPDMRPLYFIRHPEKADTIVGMRGTAFEKRQPPIFCKMEHKDVCESIRKREYPEAEMNNDGCANTSNFVSSSFGNIHVLLFLFAFYFL